MFFAYSEEKECSSFPFSCIRSHSNILWYLYLARIPRAWSHWPVWASLAVAPAYTRETHLKNHICLKIPRQSGVGFPGLVWAKKASRKAQTYLNEYFRGAILTVWMGQFKRKRAGWSGYAPLRWPLPGSQCSALSISPLPLFLLDFFALLPEHPRGDCLITAQL